MSIVKLSGSLQAHELRMNKSAEKSEEKACQAKADVSTTKYPARLARKAKGEVPIGPKLVVNVGRTTEKRQVNNDQRTYKNNVQCQHFRKYGHIKADWQYKDKAWLIDSECSNHMTGKREFFRELDESKKQKVKLDDDIEIQVKGEGTVVITTSQGKSSYCTKFTMFLILHIIYKVLVN